MKLLTLNAHSHLEKDYEQKTRLLAEFITMEKPDAVALQECSQTRGAPEACEALRAGLFPPPGDSVPVRADNHAAQLASLLRNEGLVCSWTWLPVKLGYGRLDEGLAFLFPGSRIAETCAVPLSHTADYGNWKRRMALAVRTESRGDWFCCLHMGWWDDPEEPFAGQWQRLHHSLAEKKKHARAWLMGDFNSPSGVRGQGYDLIRSDGWHDAWLSARERTGYATVRPDADGWHGRNPSPEGLRIDHIFCSCPVAPLRAETVLDGTRGPVVSDHAGVMVSL